MNREIMFRGKRTDNGEWVEGYYVFDECAVIVKGLSYSNRNDGKIKMPLVYPVDPATVGQFTGVCMSDGTKLFEGDIIEIEDKKGEKERIDVHFDWGAFRLAFIPFADRYASLTDTETNRLLDVFSLVGNIHDHPSLLQG